MPPDRPGYKTSFCWSGYSTNIFLKQPRKHYSCFELRWIEQWRFEVDNHASNRVQETGFGVGCAVLEHWLVFSQSWNDKTNS